MKKNIKLIIIFLIIIALVASIIVFFLKTNQNNTNNKEAQLSTENEKVAIDQKEDVLIVDLDEKSQEGEQPSSEQQEEPEPQDEQEQKTEEPTKSASTLTQEIYNRNSPIGTLYIPKTKLNTQVYSSVVPDQLEKMPCFLYTTGGLSKTGITLLVGHNKRNGKLFSNNKKLEVGDEFYFTDYEGTELKYTIYSKFITTEDDVSFLNFTVDAPVMALSCCTDASDENRIIILGRADLP